MTHEEFVGILAPLVLAMRAEFDAPTWQAYFRVLRDVPPGLLDAAVDVLMREPREFFPKAGELRAACERQRRVFLAGHRYDGCASCEQSKGWRTVLVDGLPRAEKCPCLTVHKAKLAGLGLLEPISALPGEAAGEDDGVYPTMDQLPTAVQQRVKLLAEQKVLS